LLSGLVLCVVLFQGRQTGATLFAIVGLVLMTASLVITLVVNVPIDRQIQSWTTGALPPDWRAIRDRWESYHGLRTLVSLAALTSLFATTLSTTRHKPPGHHSERDEYLGTSRSTAA